VLPVGNSQSKITDNNVQNSQLGSIFGEGIGTSAPFDGRRSREFEYTQEQQEQHNEAKRQRDEARRQRNESNDMKHK